jgi:hypothetical protein
MANYGTAFNKTGADNVLQVVELIAAAATGIRRSKIFSFGIGCTAASNDGVHQYTIHRVTGTATGTAVTPQPLDGADAVSFATSKHLITADAASFAAGAELYREPLNGRASWQFNANPGKEFVGPATASNGLSLGLSAASTATYAGNLQHEE